MDWVAWRRRFSDDAVGAVAEAGRRPAHRGPCRVHELEEVVQAITVRVAIWTVCVRRRGGIEPVGRFPSIAHSIAIGIPASGVFVNDSIAVIVVGGTVSIAIVIWVSCVNKAIFVVVETIGAHVANRVFIAQNNAARTVGTRVAASRLIELHSIFFVPIVHRNGAIPPNTVVEDGSRVAVVPPGWLEVEVFLEIRHAITVRIGYRSVGPNG